jgi:hypothetical protein
MPRAAYSILVDANPVVQARAECPPNMPPENNLLRNATACESTTRYAICDKWLVGLLLLALVRTGEVLAGDQVSIPGEKIMPDFNMSRQRTPAALSLDPIPAAYQSLETPGSKEFSKEYFRPRGHSILEKEPAASVLEEAPWIHGTTVWQRLSDYRIHDHVRLLTLLDTGGGSSLSLLAGRKGEPSLQWTSRSMSHGRATGGLLDQLFSTSLEGAARGLHFSPRASGPDGTSKQPKMNDAAAMGPNRP